MRFSCWQSSLEVTQSTRWSSYTAVVMLCNNSFILTVRPLDLLMNDAQCRNWSFPFIREVVFIFFPPCSHQLQSTIDALVFSISYRWPLCSSDIDLSLPFSVIRYLPHSPEGDTVCNQTRVWPSVTHTHTAVRPFPHTLTSHLRGYWRGPHTTVGRLGPREEFEDLTQE